MDRLTRFPNLWFLALRLSHLIYRGGEQRNEALRSHIQLQEDLAADSLHRTVTDHYLGGAGEKDKWFSYKQKFASRHADEVVFRNRTIRDKVIALRPRRFLNFGCLYGWLENELGRAGIEAHGVDRSDETRKLNEQEFVAAKYHAADIFAFLEQARDLTPGAMLAHINTGVYFLPRFLTRLYDTAFHADVEAILVWEPWGRSRVNGEYQTVNADIDLAPMVYRGPMLLHNYARLLKLAGYSNLVHSEIVRPPHPHPDYRSVFLIASRQLPSA